MDVPVITSIGVFSLTLMTFLLNVGILSFQVQGASTLSVEGNPELYCEDLRCGDDIYHGFFDGEKCDYGDMNLIGCAWDRYIHFQWGG